MWGRQGTSTGKPRWLPRASKFPLRSLRLAWSGRGGEHGCREKEEPASRVSLFDFDTKRRRAGRGIALVRVMLPAAHPLRLTETKFPLVFRVLGALDWRPARQNRGCGDPASRLAGEGTLLCCWASRVQGPRRDLASTSSPRPRPPREPSASRAGNDTRILSGCGRSEDNVQ